MAQETTLSLSTVTAPLNAPIEKVNIAEWLLNLADKEYQRCSSAHIAAGSTHTDDGRPMSINVETIGNALMIQHYVAEVHTPSYCKMVSISDSITSAGRSKAKVTWELRAEKVDDETCLYSNHIHAEAIDETLAFFKEHNVNFKDAAAARQAASDAHNHEETPLFAKSIERHALSR